MSLSFPSASLLALFLCLTGPPAALGHEGHVHADAAVGPPARLPGVPAGGGTSDRAIEKWTRRTASEPADADAWVSLGNALMQKSREQAAGGLYARAEAAYERALALATNHAEALVGLAWVHNTEHDFDAGTRYARRALAIDPKLQDAYALLGDAAVELGDYDEALEHYQKALDLAPNLSSYSRAAHLLWLRGDVRLAKRLMQKAIAAGGPHAENTAWCQAQLGLMMFQEGALLPAEQYLEAALAATPGNAHLLAALGRVEAARARYARAIELLERSAEILPQHAALAPLVDLYALAGEPEKSRAAFRRVLDFHAGHSHSEAAGPATPAADPGADATAGDHAHPHGHGNADLARFLADHDQDLAQALAEAEGAYERYKNVGVTEALAWCQYKNGRPQDARRTILMALRWRTPDAGLWYRAGVIFAAAGDKPAAQRQLYQALSLNPNFDPVQAPLASARLAELAGQMATERRALAADARSAAPASQP